MMTPEEIQYDRVNIDFWKAGLARAEETYQEDRAFLNRMKTVPSYRLQREEIQRLFRIAERGMVARDENCRERERHS